MAGIDKKYIKIGVVAFATVALVIGLSVGITQSKKNKSNVAAKAAATDEYSGAATYDEVVLKNCLSSSSKPGESGGGKSGKSGGSSSEEQRLVVPDTEEYGVEKDSGKRRKLRNELIRGLKDNDVDDDDGDDDDDDDDDDDGDDDDDDDDDGSISSSSKSSKSGGSKSSSRTSRDYCKKPADICSSSFSPGNSKSGKSGGGKSGKSGGSSSSSNVADTMSMSRPSTNYYYCSSSKSGKSGGGKSGKSGGSSSSSTSKSGKYTSYADDDYGPYDCMPPVPSVCEPPDYKDTPAPTPCVCEDRGWGVLDGKCQQSCEEYDGEAADTAAICCETNYSSDDLKECVKASVNTCIEVIITSPPTPTVTGYTDTPAPTPCVCEDRGWGLLDGKCQQSCEEYDGEAADTVDICCETNYSSGDFDQCVKEKVNTCITDMPTLVPTPTVTEGSTPTVSTAATGPPTVSRPTPFKP